MVRSGPPEQHDRVPLRPGGVGRLHAALRTAATVSGVCAGRTGGGWGIRTPEGLHPTRFPSVRHRPLGESSKASKHSRVIAAADDALHSAADSARRPSCELPQGRKAARVNGLWRVRGVPFFLGPVWHTRKCQTPRAPCPHEPTQPREARSEAEGPSSGGSRALVGRLGGLRSRADAGVPGRRAPRGRPLRMRRSRRPRRRVAGGIRVRRRGSRRRRRPRRAPAAGGALGGRVDPVGPPRGGVAAAGCGRRGLPG